MSITNVFKAGWGLIFGITGLAFLIAGLIALYNGLFDGDFWGGVGAFGLAALIAFVLFGMGAIGITKNEQAK